MVRSVLFDRVLKLDAVSVENPTGVDGQGALAYASPSTIDARTKEENAVVRSLDGEEVVTSLTLWVPAAETPTPVHRSRITYEGKMYEVVEVKPIKEIRGDTLIHTRFRCRDLGVEV